MNKILALLLGGLLVFNANGCTNTRDAAPASQQTPNQTPGTIYPYWQQAHHNPAIEFPCYIWQNGSAGGFWCDKASWRTRP